MNRKIALIIGCVVCGIVSVFITIQVYYYNNPEIEIHISQIVNIGTDVHIDRVQLSYNSRSIFGISDTSEKVIQSCGDELRELYENLELKMDAPRELTVSITSMSRKQIISYKGFGMVDGMEVSLNGEIVLELPVREVIYE